MVPALHFPNRIQQYDLLARRCGADLRFFNIEAAFLKNLLEASIIRLADHRFAEKRRMAIKKMAKLEADKIYSDQVLHQQFEILERINSQPIPETETVLACKQMELDYLMNNFNSEYCELKKELFTLIESITLENRS
jgi:NifB/MoaA-like Fe-S oxidoreductase